MKFYGNWLKRPLDLVASATGLIAISPLLAGITAALWVTNRGKPFFTQPRPGMNEREFRVIKFKTMTDEKDTDGKLLPNNRRITTLGRFLRSYSLDELPQLFNVIKGDMSLVGPRPLLFKYIPLYSPEQRRRHHVRPGITGLAQVNGRNTISWKKKFELDVEYVDSLSLWLDLKILAKTALRVMQASDVNASAEVTMPPFDGTN